LHQLTVIVFNLRRFLNLSLISCLAGLVIFGVDVALVVVDCFVCTLGVGAFMIGLSTVAAVIGVVVHVHWEVVVSFGFGLSPWVVEWLDQKLLVYSLAVYSLVVSKTSPVSCSRCHQVF
jgi:hypothetical protein